MPIEPKTMGGGLATDHPTNPTRPPIKMVDALSGADRITGREKSLAFLTTGAFTGAAVVNLTGWQPGVAFRVTSITWMMTENAAISGGAAEATLRLLDAGRWTGLEVGLFVPTASVSGLGVEVVGPWDLGRGFVSEEGLLSISSDQTLTSGHFRVVVAGYPEPPLP